MSAFLGFLSTCVLWVRAFLEGGGGESSSKSIILALLFAGGGLISSISTSFLIKNFSITYEAGSLILVSSILSLNPFYSFACKMSYFSSGIVSGKFELGIIPWVLASGIDLLELSLVPVFSFLKALDLEVFCSLSVFDLSWTDWISFSMILLGIFYRNASFSAYGLSFDKFRDYMMLLTFLLGSLFKSYSSSISTKLINLLLFMYYSRDNT